nr:hypothetical protein [Tanacetum cinerariifolium]
MSAESYLLVYTRNWISYMLTRLEKRGIQMHKVDDKNAPLGLLKCNSSQLVLALVAFDSPISGNDNGSSKLRNTSPISLGISLRINVAVTDIKEKDKIEAKTGQNQARNEKRGKVNQVKVKLGKTGHGFGKSAKNRSRRRKYLIEIENHFTFDTSSINSQASTRSSIHASLGHDPGRFLEAITITFDLPTVEPEDSLRMGDEHLDTILETESDKFIKSSVENLIPNPSESEDDSECDVPACDDFTTFSNLLFDADDDFSSSDNESFSDEYILKEIYSNLLFDEEIISIKMDPHRFNAEFDLIESLLNHDSLIISSSSKIDCLLDEFAGELILPKSIPPRIDETDCDPEEEIHLIEKLLYDNSSPLLPEEFIFENSDAAIESFSLFPIPVEDSDSVMEEIDLTLTLDDLMPPGIEEDDYDSERDILIVEELFSNDSISLPKNESFHFDIPSSPRPPAKLPDDDEIEPNSGILTLKVVGDISEHYVPMPRLLPTQPTLASNQEKSPHLLSYRGLKAF